MSRGGRSGGRGGRRGPDLSYDDSEQAPLSNKPAPTFPRVDFPTPKPLDSSELSAVDEYLSFRTKVRNGPFFAVLDPSNLTNDKGKVDKRAGFDPFNDQETYTAKYQPRRRTVPDLSGQKAALQFFPKELWHIIDPRRKDPMWKTIDAEMGGTKQKKRKRTTAATTEPGQAPAEEQQNSDEDSDVVVTGRRKHNAAKSRKADPITKSAKQKAGLDAEDDYPDADPDNDEEGDPDEALQDSEFDESEDDNDDYNAENYFDGGDEDDIGMDEGGGDEEGYM